MRFTIVFGVFVTMTAGACFTPHVQDGGFQCNPADDNPCPSGYACRDFGGGSFLCTNRLAPISGGGDMAAGGGGGGGSGSGGNGGEVDMSMPGSTDMATPPDMTPCTAAKLVINEILTDGATAGDEWVELFNPCGNAVTLSGKLVYRADTSMTDSNTLATFSSVSIAQNGYYLIAGSGYTGTSDMTFAAGGLAKAGGGVQLRDGSGNVIDSVGYAISSNGFAEGTTATNPPTNKSIARSPNGHDSNNNNNDFVIKTTPTPRAANQ